jgi:hypothetical protein
MTSKETRSMPRNPQPDAPTEDPLARPDDAGAYVGNRPERQAESIPGGVRPDDERIAAHSTQVGAAPPTDDDRDDHPRGST